MPGTDQPRGRDDRAHARADGGACAGAGARRRRSACWSRRSSCSPPGCGSRRESPIRSSTRPCSAARCWGRTSSPSASPSCSPASSVLLAIYLQNVLGYSALETGALLLPMTIPMFVGSLLAGWLLSSDRRPHAGHDRDARRGARRVRWSARARGQRVPALVPGMVIFGFGGAIALPSMTAAIMASATALEPRHGLGRLQHRPPRRRHARARDHGLGAGDARVVEARRRGRRAAT